MKNKNDEFKSAYAGPKSDIRAEYESDFENTEDEDRKAYPNGFMDDEEEKYIEPVMQAVYACPPPPPVSDMPPLPKPPSDGARMRHVYAAPATMLTFCPRCGKKSTKDARFCSNCGASLYKPNDSDSSDNSNSSAKRKGFIDLTRGNRDELI